MEYKLVLIQKSGRLPKAAPNILANRIVETGNFCAIRVDTCEKEKEGILTRLHE